MPHQHDNALRFLLTGPHQVAWLQTARVCLLKAFFRLTLVGMHVQVSQWNVATDVVEDYDAGLEYGVPRAILRSVQRGDAREYLVQ